MDRRHFVAGVGATIVAGSAQASVAVDRFGLTISGPSVILLYGSDGLTNNGRYEFAANMIAGAGYNVLLPRYFEATSDRRAHYGEIKSKFPVWLEAIKTIRRSAGPFRRCRLFPWRRLGLGSGGPRSQG